MTTAEIRAYRARLETMSPRERQLHNLEQLRRCRSFALADSTLYARLVHEEYGT